MLYKKRAKDHYNLHKISYIAEYVLIGDIHYIKYGIATFVKENIDDTRVVHRDNYSYKKQTNTYHEDR